HASTLAIDTNTPKRSNIMLDILWFILIGLAAGWLAGMLVKCRGFGLIGDLIVGVVGAIIGGFVFRLLGFEATNIIGSLIKVLARLDVLEGQVRASVAGARAGARSPAEQLPAALKRGNYRGPLHGIPIGVKDIFDVFDWPTAAGSKLWANSVARRDCTVVERL